MLSFFVNKPTFCRFYCLDIYIFAIIIRKVPKYYFTIFFMQYSNGKSQRTCCLRYYSQLVQKNIGWMMYVHIGCILISSDLLSWLGGGCTREEGGRGYKFFVLETCIVYLSDSCTFPNCSVSYPPLPYLWVGVYINFITLLL